MKRIEIDIENKSYSNNHCVLKNFNFAASSGEFVAVVGPSGAGKTTLLNIIGGIDSDYLGEVRTSSGPLIADHDLKIGFMFQQSRLIPWLTVIDNLSLVLKPGQRAARHSTVAVKRDRIAKLMIERVGLKGFEHRYPHQLSGGMQKRVSLARAFAIEPSLLLLDEPFQSLDSPTANRFRDQLMSMWNSQKQTVIFVTHDLREAISMADRILFLSDRPSRILLDYRVDLKRPRSIESESVATLHRSILSRHPDILSGNLQTACEFK